MSSEPDAGRVREQLALRGLLGEHPLVALHGASGVGKTALVRAFVAREVDAGRLAPGLFVSLGHAGEAGDIVAATRAALGLEAAEAQRDAEWLSALSTAAPPRTIVWDDAPATAAELVGEFAERPLPPEWRLIVVSRTALAGLMAVPMLELR